jgi:hypothetical protein
MFEAATLDSTLEAKVLALTCTGIYKSVIITPAAAATYPTVPIASQLILILPRARQALFIQPTLYEKL